MHTSTWNLDWLVCHRKLPCTCFHCPNLGLMDCTWSSSPSMLYSVLYMHVFMEASFILYSRFPPSTTATNIHLHPDYFSLLILCSLALFYLGMLHTLWMHASSEQVKLRRKRVIAIMRWVRGTPTWGLWRNLMELCELRRSRVWWNFDKMRIIFKAITGSSGHAFWGERTELPYQEILA